MNEINYEELDEECIEFVKYFNKIGLETAMSCQGHNNSNMHKYWISFTKRIKDEDIRAFIDSFPRPFYAKRDGKQILGKFVKIDFGVDLEGNDMSRWRYESDFSGNNKDNQRFAKADLDIFKEYVNII